MKSPESPGGLAHPQKTYLTAQVGSVQNDIQDREPNTEYFNLHEGEDLNTNVMEVFNISEGAPSEDSHKSNDWYEDEDEHDYGEEEAYFNSHAHKEISDLHIASLNCKGMMENTKREQLIQIMEREYIDIMWLQETWINSSSEEMKDKYLFLFFDGGK